MLDFLLYYIGTILGYLIVILVVEHFTINKLKGIFTNHYVNISIIPIIFYLLHTFYPYQGFKVSFWILFFITIVRAGFFYIKTKNN